MIVLGLADNHDSGAAVCIDGRLVSAVNQERVDRIKQSGAFPWGAIDEALRVAGLRRVSFSLDSLDPENFKKLRCMFPLIEN